MKKLSEYKDEDALELLADLITPISEIASDKKVISAFRKKSKLAGISVAIKQHKKAVMECLAILEGVSLEDYHCNIITLPKTILEIINDTELADFFVSQSQQMDKESSGSATENSEEKV